MSIEDVELHIDKLVLQGFKPRHRYRITRAMKRELGRLLEEDGVASSLMGRGEISKLDGRDFEVAVGSTPEATGIKVARVLYGGVRR